MSRELNGQYSAERKLEILVRSLGQRCSTGALFNGTGGSSVVRDIIAEAMLKLGEKPVDMDTIKIPPDISSSLAAMAHNLPRRWMGGPSNGGGQK